jgi:hypothetical protein
MRDVPEPAHQSRAAVHDAIEDLPAPSTETSACRIRAPPCVTERLDAHVGVDLMPNVQVEATGFDLRRSDLRVGAERNTEPMVWGWNYDDGPGDYTYAWLQRTEDAQAFGAWHARETVRRARLRERIERDDFSGNGTFDLSLQSEAEDLAGLELEASLEERVAWHLTRNLFPAVPTSMVSVCGQAIRFAGPGLNLDNVRIDLPKLVSFRPGGERIRHSASIAEVIRQHSLSRFILDDAGLRQAVGRAWDVNDALEAWDLANEGKWEIPSPIPSWPEFVTLLLVGRNFLEPDEEDDPSEQDQIRSWWGPNGWRRGYNAGWWDAQTVHLMSLPDPVSAAEAPANRERESVHARAAAATAPVDRPNNNSATGKPPAGGDVTDRESEFAAIGGWLTEVACGATEDPQAFLPHDWEQLIEAIWRPDDLRWTEDLIRRSRGHEYYPGKHPTGMADLDALLARLLLAQRRDEEALEALKPLTAVWSPVQTHLPYWWVQIRFLAEGRLAVQRGEPQQALSAFMNVVCRPYPGRYADPDYLLQGLHELAMLDTSRLEGAPSRVEWVRLALAVADGLHKWSEVKGWRRPTGYGDEARAQFRAILTSRRVQWDPRDPELPPIRSRSDWEVELMAIEEILDELVTTYTYNRFVGPRPFIEEIGQLWNPRDPARSLLVADELLSDAYRQLGTRTSDDTRVRATPWHWDALAITQLEALRARALAALGGAEVARSSMKRAFPPHDEDPGWIPQLEALTNGRIAHAVGDTGAAFDYFWLAVRLWLKAETDEDLLLETLCELAVLGHVSPLHPDPAEWATLVATMTHERPDDEWRPGSWFDREFRALIDLGGE